MTHTPVLSSLKWYFYRFHLAHSVSTVFWEVTPWRWVNRFFFPQKHSLFLKLMVSRPKSSYTSVNFWMSRDLSYEQNGHFKSSVRYIACTWLPALFYLSKLTVSISPPDDCAVFLAWVVSLFGILKDGCFKQGVASGIFMHRLRTWRQI